MSASGGGVLTAGTAAFKFMITAGHFMRRSLEGFLASTNYAVTFLLMQLFSFTLATKQPSMTAAALAHSMHTTAGQQDLSEVVTMIARITRSQLAAALGNVGAVIPSAIALELVLRAAHGPRVPRRGGRGALARIAAPDAQRHAALRGAHRCPLVGVERGRGLARELGGVSALAGGDRRASQIKKKKNAARFVGRRTTAWASRVFARQHLGRFGRQT